MGRMWTAIVSIVVVIGCGGCSSSTQPPTTHLIDQQSLTIPAGQALAVGPFTVPDGATVTYQITDTPTGIGSDSMTVGIATEATAQATNPTLFAAQSKVSSVTGTTPSLSAGEYDLYVACQNAIDNCIFDETVTGYY